MSKDFIRSLVYSSQHTGTFFAIEAITSGIKTGYHLSRFGSLYQRHIDLGHPRYFKDGPHDLSDWCPVSSEGLTIDWYDEYITSLAKVSIAPPKEEEPKHADWDKINIMVSHEHNHKSGNPIIRSIRQVQPEFPIVVPMRDPLLSLHSKNWREVKIHGNKQGISEKKRIVRCRKWVTLYKEFLSLPAGRVFLLPCDGEQSKTEQGRIDLIRDLHHFVGINFNKTAHKWAAQWQPANSTQALVERKTGSQSKPWVKFKEEYAKGNVDFVRKHMPIEFDILQKEGTLKNLLQQKGYRNLIWW